MDTRTKILDARGLEQFHPARPLLLVTGRFDFLRAELAAELHAARGRCGARSLLVEIRPDEGAWAPPEARAEMAAALRVVDYVFIARNEEHLAAALHPVATISLEESEARRAGELTEHVRKRQSR